MVNINIFLCVCLGSVGLPTPAKETQLASVGTAVGILWLLGTMTHLNQAVAITTPLLFGAPEVSSESPLAAPHIANLAEQLRQSPNLVDQPIPSSWGRYCWRATRRTTTVYGVATPSDCHERGTFDDNRERMGGDLVVLGEDEESRKQLIDRLQQVSRLKPIDGGKGFVLLSVEEL